jgi:hypothetical protein
MKEKFHHRLNADGTIDSICLSCFLTAARADIGSDLQELLAAHQCDNKEPFILSDTIMYRFFVPSRNVGMAGALNTTGSLVRSTHTNVYKVSVLGRMTPWLSGRGSAAAT